MCSSSDMRNVGGALEKVFTKPLALIKDLKKKPKVPTPIDQPDAAKAPNISAEPAQARYDSQRRADRSRAKRSSTILSGGLGADANIGRTILG